MSFVGRKTEIEVLQRFIKKTTSSFIVVRGRRRIGKSRLIKEFAKPYKFYNFSGVVPTTKTTAQSERDEFASQLHKHGFPKIQAQDWNDLFWLLAEKVVTGRVIILFDEISWMGSCDPYFLGKLKNAWDLYFQNNQELILIVCGSASSWIEENILSSTGFVGRISFTLNLDPLPLNDCQQFWGVQAKYISAYEKLKILSITGGIPRYLEEIDPSLSAEDNIRNMCFTKGALLVNEFDHIFSNIFLRNSEVYRHILECIANGNKEFNEICKELGVVNSGRVLEYLKELELAGFVSRDYTWNIVNGQDSRLSKFRLSDNYLRFYLKYIAKYKSKIERNIFKFKSLTALPGWDAIIGLQFENLVLNNRPYLWRHLNLKIEDLVSENPFFQHKNTKQQGCQIDYLIQTTFSTLYICEIKFSKNKLSAAVIKEVDQKIKRLERPKGMSCRPVLVHVNGVEEEVEDSGYFSSIIDFSQIFL